MATFSQLKNKLEVPDPNKLEIMRHLTTMWKVFSRNITTDKEKDIVEFMEAKDRVHQLLSQI